MKIRRLFVTKSKHVTPPFSMFHRIPEQKEASSGKVNKSKSSEEISKTEIVEGNLSVLRKRMIERCAARGNEKETSL